ncbi:helix-turn-helix transcriptional regulator [uncultured Nostoc sp.]|uniref:helix-turn-helix transcriptional regulator n=1 Tax=uncultured Nostoc sp. TaxID=340711 RepID=UPI0035CA6301|nr:helix-turn-helix domain-containing protein [Nostoc desertorum CM1-VF14]
MLHTALRMIRIFHDLTQKQLAEKLGISKSHISEIESGKKTPSLELLNQYSKAFDIPVSSIMFFSESLNKDVKTEQVRTFVSSKILALLNFIAERSERSYAEE